MAKELQAYDQQIGTPAPTDFARARGEDLSIASGLHDLGTATKGVGEAMFRRQQMDEMSTGTAQMAAFRAKKTQEWQDTIRTADPNDPQVAQKYLQQYDDDYAKLKESLGFSTPRAQIHLESLNQEVRGHLGDRALQGQAELAAVKARADYGTTLNSLSSTLETSPSSYESVLAQHDHGVDELVKSHGLSQETAIELKQKGRTQLAQSAALGWIDADPQHAKEIIQKGAYDTELNGEQKFELLMRADQHLRAQDAGKKLQDKEAKEELLKQQQDTQNDFLGRLEQGKLSTRDVLKSNLSAFGSGSKEQFIKLIDARSKQHLEANPTVLKDLFDRIHAPDGDPNKITDPNQLNPYVGQGLDFSNLNYLRKEMDGMRTPEGKARAEMWKNTMNIAKGKLTKSNPLLGTRDPQGDAQYAQASIQMRNAFDEGKKAGKTDQQLLDPKSKDWIGSSIDQFVRSPQQIMQDQIKSLRPKTGGGPVSGGSSGSSPGTANQDPLITKFAAENKGLDGKPLTYDQAKRVIQMRQEKAARGGK